MHERQLREKQDQVIEQQNQRIRNLEAVVTARDLIGNLDALIRNGFKELGVAEHKLEVG